MITQLAIDKVAELCSDSTRLRGWVLLIDAMHIRREVCGSASLHIMVGLADSGNSGESDVQDLAQKAVVIMAVGFCSSWKLPVAYILPVCATPPMQSQVD